MTTARNLIIYDEESNVLDISETNKEYALGHVIESIRYKGRFFISSIERDTFFAQRIPEFTSEEEYIKEFLETNSDTGVKYPMVNLIDATGESAVPTAVRKDDHTIIHLQAGLVIKSAKTQKLSESIEDKRNSLLSEDAMHIYTTCKNQELLDAFERMIKED